MRLHPSVLFLADRPNPKKNLSLAVPFVGTPAYKVLLNWMYKMDLDVNHVSMYFTYTVDGRELPVNIEDFRRVITLGYSAEAYLEKWNETVLYEKSYFSLPDPSDPIDKKKLSDLLVRCRKFIHG